MLIGVPAGNAFPRGARILPDHVSSAHQSDSNYKAFDLTTSSFSTVMSS